MTTQDETIYEGSELSPEEEAFIEETLADLPPVAGSFVQVDRRVSRASLQWFQEQTKTDPGLIGSDGKLSDEYILKRQSVNKPATLKTIPILADLTTEIQEIDGWVLTELLLSGYAKMASKIDELNKINVFPIADGDTGANMKICLKLPTRNLLLDPSDNILTVASNMAADVLLNGQGNSGTILSHFFVSMAEEVKHVGKDSLSLAEFVSCLSKAGLKMDDAVPNPVEGTLLSVCRDCTQLADGASYKDLKSFLAAWNQKAQEELAATPDKLIVNGEKVLEKAGVVDSGAQGFVYLVEGMYLASLGELPSARDPQLFAPAKPGTSDEPPAVNMDHSVCDTKYQYCTEAVVLLKEGCTKADVVAAVTGEDASEYGDSVACVGAPAKGGGDMIKLHIHSNDPQKVFDKVAEFSRDPILKKEKVEDMWEMRLHTHERDEDALDLSDAKFTIMGMCSYALPESLCSPDMYSLPVFLVPSDTQEPIDIRFMSSSEVGAALNRQRHKETAIRYTSAASNPLQIKIELLSALAKNKPILVFIFSADKRVSALGRNVINAIELLLPEQQKMIKVLNHGWGVFEAPLLVEAMKCAKEGKTLDEAFEYVTRIADRNLTFTSFYSAATVRNLVAWRPTLFPKGFTVKDGEFSAMGLAPGIREDVWPDMKRAGSLLKLLERYPSMEKLQEMELERIREAVKPGLAISDLMVQCVGRPDHGHAFVKRLKEANIPLVNEPIVFLGGALTVAIGGWGEIALLYNLVET